MSQLYFNNNQKETVDLKKAEILMYYGTNGAISYQPIGFPNIESKIISKPAGDSSININGISSNFYPISMTIWGKIYDINTNTFKMVELNDNTNNITTFIVNGDKINLNIGTGKTMDITKLGATDEKKLLQNITSPVLISKIIILYDDQTQQSMIKKTDAKEPYDDIYNKMYIGIM